MSIYYSSPSGSGRIKLEGYSNSPTSPISAPQQGYDPHKYDMYTPTTGYSAIHENDILNKRKSEELIAPQNTPVFPVSPFLDDRGEDDHMLYVTRSPPRFDGRSLKHISHNPTRFSIGERTSLLEQTMRISEQRSAAEMDRQRRKERSEGMCSPISLDNIDVDLNESAGSIAHITNETVASELHEDEDLFEDEEVEEVEDEEVEEVEEPGEKKLKFNKLDRMGSLLALDDSTDDDSDYENELKKSHLAIVETVQRSSPSPEPQLEDEEEEDEDDYDSYDSSEHEEEVKNGQNTVNDGLVIVISDLLSQGFSNFEDRFTSIEDRLEKIQNEIPDVGVELPLKQQIHQKVKKWNSCTVIFLILFLIFAVCAVLLFIGILPEQSEI
ncbi:hypothetical protein PCE1_003943 [Barthelona sp. PCE]